MKPSLKNLSSSLSQRHFLKLTLSPPSARLILNVAATETQRHWPTNRPKPLISLRPTPPSASDPAKKSGYWVPDWETHGACRPTPSTNPCWHCPPNSVIGDFLFCLWLVILFGLGWKKRLQIWVGGFFFFFFSCCGLVVVVVGVVVAVANDRGGCGWCCWCFLGNEIYYFIVMFILFYYVES